MANIFTEPLIFQNGTGFVINPNNTEIFSNQTVVFSIGQAVETTSDVVFNQITVTTDKFIIDNEDLLLKDGQITGSLSISSNTTISNDLTGSANLIISGTLTAGKIETELTQSVTLFESGSTKFGDTSDDTHQFSGSYNTSGSLNLVNSVAEVSNDTSFTDGNSTSLFTENALKTYVDDISDDIQLYLRKSFVHTGSFISTSTSSFTAVTASAPSGYTTTNEDDFMFFINGQLMEHDALTVQQSSSYFYLKVDNDSIGYDVASTDEIVAWGKFNS